MKNKRVIVSKWDGRNYLGHSPNGEIYNMRKNLEGRFYKYVRKDRINGDSKGAAVGDPLKKSEFILVE